MIKYTVIVPAYNLECFIEECLNSILKQTYSNIEIIVIDDGSSDNTADICGCMAEKDERIQLIHQENKGVSVARNVGLMNASGDYIFFVDGDDFIDENYISVANRIIEESMPDVLITNNYYSFNNTTRKKILKEMFPVTEEVKKKQVHILNYILDSCYQIPGGISFNIYKSEYLRMHHCCFADGKQWFEDLDFFLQVMQYNPSYELTDIKYYYYRHRQSSNSTACVTTKKILDKMDIICKWYNYITNCSLLNDDPFYKLKYWLQREYYVNLAFCVPCNSSTVDYKLLENKIMIDSYVWKGRYPRLGVLLRRFGLKGSMPLIKIVEYGKVILGIRK